MMSLDEKIAHEQKVIASYEKTRAELVSEDIKRLWVKVIELRTHWLNYYRLEKAFTMGYTTIRMVHTVTESGEQTEPRVQVRVGLSFFDNSLASGARERWLYLDDPEAPWNVDRGKR